MLFKRKLENALLIGVAGVVGLLGATSISLAQGDTWTTKRNMPTKRFWFSCEVVDGKIYAIGGVLYLQFGTTAPVHTVEVYDPATDTWEKKADIPTARDAASASVVNDTIYVIGGVAPGGVALNVVEAYDPATDTWTEKRSMQYARWPFVNMCGERKNLCHRQPTWRKVC